MSDGMRANIAQHLGRLVELANTERADREDGTDAVERSATRGDEAIERAGKLLTTYICDQNRIADALDIIAGAARVIASPPAPMQIEIKSSGALTQDDLDRIRQAVQDLPADAIVKVPSV